MMQITRRNALANIGIVGAAMAGVGTLALEESCATTTADDITLIIGAAEGVADIALPLIPAGSALIPFFNAGLTALGQVVTEWGSSDITTVKWQKMLTILLAIPAEILKLSPGDQAIVAGFGTAIQLIISVITQLQGGTVAAATARVSGASAPRSVGAPSAKGVSSLLGAIKATQGKLAGMK